MTTIKREPAVVYRATVKCKAGTVSRRFFVKRAAIEWAARELIKSHCTCESWTSFDEPGYSCQYHDGSEGARRIHHRLVRAIKYAMTPDEAQP